MLRSALSARLVAFGSVGDGCQQVCHVRYWGFYVITHNDDQKRGAKVVLT